MDGSLTSYEFLQEILEGRMTRKPTRRRRRIQLLNDLVEKMDLDYATFL